MRGNSVLCYLWQAFYNDPYLGCCHGSPLLQFPGMSTTLLRIYLVILSIDHTCPVPQELWSTYLCTNGNKETEFNHQYSRYPHRQQPPNVPQTVVIVGFPRLDNSDDSLQDVSPSHPASSSATPLPPTLPLQTLVGGQHPSLVDSASSCGPNASMGAMSDPPPHPSIRTQPQIRCTSW